MIKLAKTKIIVPRGASYKLTAAFYYSTGERFIEPTATVKAYAKRKLEQSYYDIELGGNYTNSADGAAWVFTFDPEDTEHLTPGRYFFEIRVDGTNAGGTDYSYVAVSVSDVDFYIDYSVLTPTTNSQASVS